MTAPDPRLPRTGPLDPLASDPRHVVLAFDQAVDRIGEEAGFLALGDNRQAARYVADAHAVLDDVRATMHRIDARASDPMLRKGARRRLHALAVSVAEAGLRDAEHVSKTARHLSAPAKPGSALRVHAVKAAAWGVEKWTGSPLAPIELRSTAAATQAVTAVEPIVRRGRLRRAPGSRSLRRTGIVTAAVGGGSLALYGAWSLVAPLLGLG
ncbi:hypothetical protein [Microbacterium lacusdiani]